MARNTHRRRLTELQRANAEPAWVSLDEIKAYNLLEIDDIFLQNLKTAASCSICGFETAIAIPSSIAAFEPGFRESELKNLDFEKK